MDTLQVVAQVIVAIGIFNVWLLRYGKSTPYRGGNASNMREEFKAYGLPYSFMLAIGVFKLTLATLLIVGIWYPTVTQPAALGMAVLMSGAIAMHLKVKDSVRKALPAASMLMLSLFIAFS